MRELKREQEEIISVPDTGLCKAKLFSDDCFFQMVGDLKLYSIEMQKLLRLQRYYQNMELSPMNIGQS